MPICTLDMERVDMWGVCIQVHCNFTLPRVGNTSARRAQSVHCAAVDATIYQGWARTSAKQNVYCFGSESGFGYNNYSEDRGRSSGVATARQRFDRTFCNCSRKCVVIIDIVRVLDQIRYVLLMVMIHHPLF